MSTLKTNTLSNVAGTASTAIENAINGSAKAWVNFNGTGTVAIRQGYNVSSITDLGTGYYTVNFTTAMPDANYSALLTINQATNGNWWVDNNLVSGNALTTSGFTMYCNASEITSTSPADPFIVCAAIFR
jgi:hypothetical protein